MLSSPCGAPDAVNPDTLTNAQYPDSIAYEYDGDLWLIELDSLRKSRLTADGNNRYSAWSADGRYLVYEHFAGNKTDLRILDVQAKKDWLFQSNACCAAWSPEGNALAFFSHDNYDFEMAYLAASDATSQLCCGNWVGTAPFAAPDTPMFWSADNWLYIPGLDPPSSRRIQVYDMESTGFSWLTVPDRNSCFYALSKAPDQGLLAVTQDKSCTLTPDNPQVVIMDDNGVWHELPTASSSYLSWSTDGTWVAYEGSALRCAVSPCPYGINILNMDTLENRLIVEGGAQPAWRPLCK